MMDILSATDLLPSIRQTEVDLLAHDPALVPENFQKRDASLTESETDQQNLLGASLAGVIIIDPITCLVESVNESAAAMFGLSAGDIVGHSWPIEGVCSIVTADNMEHELLCADGHHRFILRSVTRAKILGQEKLLECFVDITERKQAETALQRHCMHLEEIVKDRTAFLSIAAEAGNRAKGAFWANVSHELRTVAHSIFGMTDFMLRSSVEPVLTDRLNMVMQSSKRLFVIIDNMHEISKIKAE